MRWLSLGVVVLISSLGVLSRKPATETVVDPEARRQIYQIRERQQEAMPIQPLRAPTKPAAPRRR